MDQRSLPYEVLEPFSAGGFGSLEGQKLIVSVVFIYPVNTSQPAQLSQKLEVSSIIIVSLLSLEYWAMHSDDCFMLLMQVMALAFCLAEFNAGRSSAARMAIIAMTTSNSISEKYLFISTSPYSFL